MATQFTQIPDVLLVPGNYQEIDNSLAGTTSDLKKILIVGTYVASALVVENKPVRITSKAKASELFGFGSPLAMMSASYLESNKNVSHEVYALPIQANGIAYSEKFTLTGSFSSDGQVIVNINSLITKVLVKKTDTAEGGVLDLVSVAKGTDGIQISFDSEDNGLKIVASDKVESKLTLTANWKEIFENLGNTRYNYIVCGLSDVDTLKAWSEELESRYSALRQIGGRMFAYLSGVVGDAITENSIIHKAEKINSPHIVLLPYHGILSTPYSFVSKIACEAIDKLAIDPASNTYNLKVSNLVVKKDIETSERELLLQSGVATWITDAQGYVCIERLVTSYTTNSEGERDTSYLDIQVVETVDAIRTYINSEAKKRFKGWKLANTEENFGAGAKVMTPGVWKSYLAELYKSVFMSEKQWVQDFENYKDSLKAEVKQGSKTRLEYIHSPILIGQFYQSCGLNQFK